MTHAPGVMAEHRVTVQTPLLRGARRLRIALVGVAGAGKATLFDAVSSTAPLRGELSALQMTYRACTVQVGLDEASVVELPSLGSALSQPDEQLKSLLALLTRPADAITSTPSQDPTSQETPSQANDLLPPPDLIIQVIDATDLQAGLALTLALREAGRPIVVALNRMDEVRQQGQHLNLAALSRALAMPVVPTVALMGQGLTELFNTAMATARASTPLNQAPPAANRLSIPAQANALLALARRPGASESDSSWRVWLDDVLLSPTWGLLLSLAVFAVVLWVVFEGSGWIDEQTTQRVSQLFADWQPDTLSGVLGRAVLDGFIGLMGIVLPYMIPLVLLLIALEEVGLMQRIAFVVDRGFHKIGLHGGVAVPFLLGLGCNVPAISAAARTSSGRERIIASLLITFVPCSARSAIILAIAGKYLGVAGVVGIYALTLVLIAVMGRLLSRQHTDVGPGQVQEIPPFRWPQWRAMLSETWSRTSDILTIVAPLLVGGSVVLALLNHVGADAGINTLLTPLTVWWLGLPLVLGLPLLFGVLRKELSLLMIFQALGTSEIGSVLSNLQIITLLLFLTFYVPCISTFAVMYKILGRKEAWFSVALSVGVALLISGSARLVLTLI